MPDTFIKIASVTVGSGGASSIDFTSIPSTYTDLCLKISGRSTHSSLDQTEITFNGSATGYNYRSIFGDGSSAASYGSGGSAITTYIPLQYLPGTAQTSSTFTSSEMYIPNYAGGDHKSVSFDTVEENNATAAYALIYAAIWSNTAAITSIKIDPQNGNFAQYSTAVLYGIKSS